MPSPDVYYARRDDWRLVRGRSDTLELRGVGMVVKCEGRIGWRFLPLNPVRGWRSFVRLNLEEVKREVEALITERK